jgi:hypothetical protein
MTTQRKGDEVGVVCGEKARALVRHVTGVTFTRRRVGSGLLGKD